LNPDYSIHVDPLATVSSLRLLLETGLVDSVNRLTHGRAGSLAEAMDSYLATMSEDAGWVRSDNALFLSQPVFRELLQTAGAPVFSLRHAVYAALPELLAGAFDPTRIQMLAAARRLESARFKVPSLEQTHPVAWEILRALAVKAWFIIHH
jgi:hypothetical protein